MDFRKLERRVRSLERSRRRMRWAWCLDFIAASVLTWATLDKMKEVVNENKDEEA